MSGSSLFAGLDRASFVAAYADRLAVAGLPVPLQAVGRVADALELIGSPTGRGLTKQEVYWVLRVGFLRDVDDLPVFDQVFAAVFDVELNRSVRQGTSGVSFARHDDDRLVRTPGAADRGPTSEGAGVPWATRPTVVGVDQDQVDAAVAVPELVASSMTADDADDLDPLDPDVLAELDRLVAGAADRWPRRIGRRRRLGGSRGRTELRATLRRALRSGGEPIHWIGAERRPRPRRIVLVLDLSRSMQSYAAPHLHLVRALATAGRAEVFAFSTELTRLTAAVRRRSPEDAIERATAEVGDRFGGTRIASSLTRLARHPVWGGLVRGAIVVIVSDGWDSEPPERMADAMARLARRSHRIVWVNPRAAAADFQPAVASMAAALTWCDDLVASQSVDDAALVVDAITRRN